MTSYDWHSCWRTEGRAEVSDSGWIIHPVGGLFELFMVVPSGPPVSRGKFISASEARIEADYPGLVRVRERLSTGAPGHETIGGYDVTVARLLAADLPDVPIATCGQIVETDDDAPDIITIMIQVVYGGIERHVQKLLVGSRAAARQRQDTGQAMGRALSYDQSEVARVPEPHESDPDARDAVRRNLIATYDPSQRATRLAEMKRRFGAIVKVVPR